MQIFKLFFEKNLINFIESMLSEMIAIKLIRLCVTILGWNGLKYSNWIYKIEKGFGGAKPPDTLENFYVRAYENYWNFIIFSFFPSFYLWFSPFLILQKNFVGGLSPPSPLGTPLVFTITELGKCQKKGENYLNLITVVLKDIITLIKCLI